jgi:uroporphyrinogen decarboxylase
VQEIFVNARERVRQALLYRKPDRIPKTLGFFNQSLAAIAPTRPENYFALIVRFAEFDPPHNQDEFRCYMDIPLLDEEVAMPYRLKIGTQTWRGYFKPRPARVINLAREESPNLLIFYHGDGNFARLILDLVDIGVNVAIQ